MPEATPFVYMKYEEPLITFEMIGEDIGYNIFEKPFEYMKYEEPVITFEMIGEDSK
jgi:hypothetical protein